eukprot:TRINITY_DN5408_c0_g1_i1.p1 TRINITY_DN5408_c0_g1~~TRINITY_DN5408_c0_g1_i1.p1  ORF type:complete len:172 (-),score=47.79 TRINITY_DN5408_c0_g1_i1:94-609(-)
MNDSKIVAWMVDLANTEHQLKRIIEEEKQYKNGNQEELKKLERSQMKLENCHRVLKSVSSEELIFSTNQEANELMEKWRQSKQSKVILITIQDYQTELKGKILEENILVLVVKREISPPQIPRNFGRVAYFVKQGDRLFGSNGIFHRDLDLDPNGNKSIILIGSKDKVIGV